MIKIESSEKEFNDLVEKRKQEIRDKVNKKISRIKRNYQIIEFILTFIGYVLIIYHTNVWLALGIWLAMWGNNMGMTRAIHGASNIWREIWK